MDGGQTLRVAVVGGGVAGLAAAEALAGRDSHVEIFDAGNQLGGRIAPALMGEREICLGGKNVGHRYARFRALLARRGHADYEFFGPDSAQVIRGRIRTLSFRSPSMRARLGARLAVRGQAARGLRFMRLASHVARYDESKFLGDPYFADLAVRTGDPPLPEYVGTALCRDVIRHMTVRMNGAEPDECHLGTLGSNLGLVVDRFDQLRGGALTSWLHDLADDFPAHLGTRVTRLLHDGERVTGVATADGEEHDGFDAVILAVPAFEGARLVRNLEPSLARALGTVRYFPVAVVVAEYASPIFPDRFAALSAPSGMALSNAGSYGLGDRHLIRFTFSGRAARGRIEPDTFDPAALLAEAEAFLSRHTAIGRVPRVGYAAHAFDPGLCAYRRDHAALIREARASLGRLPGLELAGDYVRGASLEACVRSGEEAAERVVGSTLGAAHRSSRSAALEIGTG
jgi:protoporphyrinogen/coproporphyrinogen III oxidase